MENKNKKNILIKGLLSVLTVLIVMAVLTEVVAKGHPCGNSLPCDNIILSVGGDTQGKTGDNVTIFVNITDADNLSRLKFDLIYNKSVLDLIDVENGSVVLSDFHWKSIQNGINFKIGPPDNNPGTPFITRVDGTGTIAVIKFTVIGTVGMSNMNISAYEGYTRDTEHNKSDINVVDSIFYINNEIPVINNVSLDNYTPKAGDDILVTVNVTDNFGISSVTANGILLSNNIWNNIWNGSIIAIGGTHPVNVSASDFVGNTVWDNSTYYSTIEEEGDITPTPTTGGGNIGDITPTSTPGDNGEIGAPEIIYSIPRGLLVENYVGDSRTFEITINQTVDVTWYLNGSSVEKDRDVTHSSYTNDNAPEGRWRLTAVAKNDNGRDSRTWTWNVTTPTVTATPTATQNEATPTPTATQNEATPTPTATQNEAALQIPSNQGVGSGGGFDNSEIVGEPVCFEERENDLRSGLSTTYSFNFCEFAIYQIVVVGKENEYNVGIRVTKIKDNSEFSDQIVPDISYTNESVTSETQRLDSVLVRFKVNNSRMERGNINRDSIQLYKLINGSWKMLVTQIKDRDDRYTYYESKDTNIARWQLFAISGKINSLPEVTPVPTVADPVSKNEATAPVSVGMPWLLIILAIILVASIAYWVYKRNGKKNHKVDSK